MEFYDPNYLEAYDRITIKIKKRFWSRKPNYQDAIDSYHQLANLLRSEGNHPYAAFCCLAAARCCETINQQSAETSYDYEAGQEFVKAEFENKDLHQDGFDEYITEAIQCYQRAAQAHLREKRAPLAGSLYLELAESLQALNNLDEAAHYFDLAAKLLVGDSLRVVTTLAKSVHCKAKLGHVEAAVDTTLSLLSMLVPECPILPVPPVPSRPTLPSPSLGALPGPLAATAHAFIFTLLILRLASDQIAEAQQVLVAVTSEPFSDPPSAPHVVLFQYLIDACSALDLDALSEVKSELLPLVDATQAAALDFLHDKLELVAHHDPSSL